MTCLAILTPAALGILPLGCGEVKDERPAASRPAKVKRTKPKPSREECATVAATATDPRPPEAISPTFAVEAKPAPPEMAAVGKPLPEQKAEEIQANPDYHARLADLFLDRVVPKHDWHRVRFISFLGTPAAARPDRLRTLNFWLNNLHFESSVELLREVPRSDGQLFWFYLDDYGWSPEAWRVVALREPYFVEPAVYFDAARSLQGKLGIVQDKKTLHLEAIVRADWLFRESVESDKSTTYYDLLFSRQRFGEVAWETKTVTIQHPGGKYVYPDDSGRVVPHAEPGRYTVDLQFRKGGSKAVDFPKNEKDWEKAFGIDVVSQFLKSARINAKHGAVVDEGVSIVARNNRLLEAVRVPTGSAWKTYDVNATAAGKDFVENLFADDVFDAAELIANLPAGGQAYFLIDGKGNRVETADPKIAIDNTDSKDRRVRTPGSCVVCHEAGIIAPKNLVQDLLASGIDILFRDKKKARDAKGFFLGWENELEADQKRYTALLAKTSGWQPGVNAAKFKEFRDAYDAPLTAEQAALELGVPVDAAKLVWAKSPRVRLLQLVQGQTIPRSVWEGGEYRQAILLLDLARAKK